MPFNTALLVAILFVNVHHYLRLSIVKYMGVLRFWQAKQAQSNNPYKSCQKALTLSLFLISSVNSVYIYRIHPK